MLVPLNKMAMTIKNCKYLKLNNTCNFIIYYDTLSFCQYMYFIIKVQLNKKLVKSILSKQYLQEEQSLPKHMCTIGYVLLVTFCNLSLNLFLIENDIAEQVIQHELLAIHLPVQYTIP